MKRAAARIVILVMWIGITAGPAAVAAEGEPDKLGWYNRGEFGLAFTDGNSNTLNGNLGYKLQRKWEVALFSFQASAVRTSTDDDRFAVGTATDFKVRQPSLELDNEYLNVRGDYNRKITDRFFWNAGAGWERNTSAGIENRSNVFAGVGNIWYATEKVNFRTNYGLSYVDQEDEIPDPATDDAYTALRFASDFDIKLGKNTTYDQDFVIFGNVSDADDFNFNLGNQVAVSMSEALALQVGLRFLYDNIPALEEIDLYAPGDLTTPIGTVVAPNDDLDVIFTLSLVVNFGPK